MAEAEIARQRNAHIVERTENEVSPDYYAQIFVGWGGFPREPKGPKDPLALDRDLRLAVRLARTDFVEKVRDFLDHGLD